RADLYDLRWLAPLPAEHLSCVARGYASVLVVDETRRSGGVSERVLTALVDADYAGTMRRVTSEDSVIPLGPAAGAVLLDEATIAAALTSTFPPRAGNKDSGRASCPPEVQGSRPESAADPQRTADEP